MSTVRKEASKDLLTYGEIGTPNENFVVGDCVRSYRCSFSNELPFRNAYLEGVVVDIESWVKPNDRLVIKWYTDKYFDQVYKFKSVVGGSDTFGVFTDTPFLVKQHKLLLAL